MDTSTINQAANTHKRGLTLLNKSAQFWFMTAVLGQWIFAYYLAITYGTTGLSGDFAAWNEELYHGYVEGDKMGNVAIGAHLLLAFIIMVGGPLQFIPYLRNHYKTFHQWNGRIYATIGVITSISGLYMVWVRGTIGDLPQHLSVTVNAILIIFCAYFTWSFAKKKMMDRHRRWAFRLFMVMNGVWFFRVGLMFWLMVNSGPVGFDPESFTGPFLTILGISQYLLPLLLLEWYFHAQEKGAAQSRYALSAVLLLFTLITGIGIFGASVGMWFPA